MPSPLAESGLEIRDALAVSRGELPGNPIASKV
jgi:hypothetical protein